MNEATIHMRVHLKAEVVSGLFFLTQGDAALSDAIAEVVADGAPLRKAAANNGVEFHRLDRMVQKFRVVALRWCEHTGQEPQDMLANAVPASSDGS